MKGINVHVDGVLPRIPKGGVGIELGVWKGRSSVKFHGYTNPKMLHLVDSWSVQPYKQTSEWTWEEYIQRYQTITGGFTEQDFDRYYDMVYNEVLNNFKDYSNVKVWRSTTDEFFEKSGVNNVDWVYVDASHSYDGVTQDLENVLKVINEDGKIFGDDFCDQKIQVKEAVKDFAKKHNFRIDNFNHSQYELKKQ